MDGVFSAIGSKDSSQGLWLFLLSFLRVSWADIISPSSDSPVGGKLHTNADIACDKFFKSRVERLSLMLSIELSDGVSVEFRHFKLINLETPSLNCIDYLTHALVRIRLDHSEGRFPLHLLLPGSCNIAILLNFEDPGKDSDLGSNKQIG